MKFYDSIGPNPRLVRVFMQEKGIEIPHVQIDIMGGENRQAEYLKVNPSGQMPALVLDDGTPLAETVAICEYLEAKHPEPPLVGATPEEAAVTRMWVRRVEHKVVDNLGSAFRYGAALGMFKDRMHVIPQAADDFKACAQEGYAWFDGQMADGRDFVAGDRFSLADIVLYSFADFGNSVGQPIEPSNKRVQAWFERVAARPSVEASQNPL